MLTQTHMHCLPQSPAFITAQHRIEILTLNKLKVYRHLCKHIEKVCEYIHIYSVLCGRERERETDIKADCGSSSIGVEGHCGRVLGEREERFGAVIREILRRWVS